MLAHPLASLHNLSSLEPQFPHSVKWRSCLSLSLSLSLSFFNAFFSNDKFNMRPKIVSLVSSFRSTQVVRPTGKQAWSGVCTGPGVGSAGEGCLCGLLSGWQ